MSAADDEDEHDCPACGCNDWKVLSSESSSGRIFGGGWISRVMRTVTVRRCNHCGHRYRSTDHRDVGAAVANPRTAKPAAPRAPRSK